MLIPEIAVVLLDEIYSPRCTPPWSWSELQHKCEDAEYKSDAAWGFMDRRVALGDGHPAVSADANRPHDQTSQRVKASNNAPAAPPSLWRSPSVTQGQAPNVAASAPAPTTLATPPTDLATVRIIGTERRGAQFERFALRLEVLDGDHAGLTKLWWLDWPPNSRSSEKWKHLALALGLDEIRDPRMDTWQREVVAELVDRSDGTFEVRRVYAPVATSVTPTSSNETKR
jgi:hypothetical protein